LFTSANIQKFQHEKPFIYQNAQNNGNSPTWLKSVHAVMSTSATLEYGKKAYTKRTAYTTKRRQLFSCPLVK